MSTKQWEQFVSDYAAACRAYLHGDYEPPEPLRSTDALKLIESRDYWRRAARKARRELKDVARGRT
jgi:hypothetical protein